MEIFGTITAVLQPKSGTSARTGNAWMSADYVIQTNEQYPKKCVFTVFGEDRIKQFNIQQGEQLTIHIDIDAHEYNGRWFNEVRCYNVVRAQMQQPMQQGYVQQPMQPQGGYQQQPMQQGYQQQAQSPFPPQQPMQQPMQQAAPQGAQSTLPFPPQQ